MYRRPAVALLGLIYLVSGVWGQGAGRAPESKSDAAPKSEERRKTSATVEVQGVGVVRLPAEGVRIVITSHLRMPRIKEALEEDARLAAKLEQAWRQLGLGNMQIRTIDQQFQAVRTPDPNQPALDLHDLPVVGYSVCRSYIVEISDVPAEQLPEAAAKVQKVAVEHGAVLGTLVLNHPLGNVMPGPGAGDSPAPSPITYFRRNPEEAYQQALKQAKDNAWKKVQALYGDAVPLRMTIQEVNLTSPDAPISSAVPQFALRAPLPAGQFSRFASAAPEVEIVAVVRLICEY